MRRIFRRRWVRALVAPFTEKRLKFLPALESIRTYDRANFNRDARAGLLVALLALPQGLAFASIAGLPPSHGVFGAIAGLLLGALFAGGRHTSFGPSVTTAVLLMSIFVQLEISPVERADAVAVLLALSAVILCLGAWFRLALLSRFISRSVTTGFIVAGGILILGTQLKHALGLSLPDTGIFVSDLVATFSNLGATHWQALLVAGITAAVYVLLARHRHALPAAALAMGVGALFAWMLELAGYPLVHVTAVSRNLLAPGQSGFRFEWAGAVASAAFATALLSHLEVSLIGRSYASRAGDRFDANQNMFALGLANLGNAFVSGMPASVSLSRTRVNWRMRPATPLTGVLAAFYCTALYAVLAPFIHLIPKPALAALAMILATEIASRHYVKVILRSSRTDALVLLTTIAAGLLFRLDVALYLGTGLSILFFLRRVGVPQLTEYGFTEQGQLTAVGSEGLHATPDISIVHVEGDLFFGAAEIFFDQARLIFEDPNLQVIILRMKNAHHLDATCAIAIEDLLRFARDRGRHVIVSGAHREIFRVFRNSGLLELIGRENFFMHVPSNPTLSTRNALKRAQKLLGGREANIRIYVDPATKGAAAPSPAKSGETGATSP